MKRSLMKTSSENLVDMVLETLPTPHTEHVIDDVFQTIDNNPAFFKIAVILAVKDCQPSYLAFYLRTHRYA
jgi:hypothetical protein